jgi:alkylhydroperoxidase/carboxymuconolactone decarboxylase family protein YurZ
MTKLPSFYSEFRDAYPEVVAAYEALGEATRRAGPLSPAQAEIVKLAFAAGARMEGAVHSHTRRALEAGATREELDHVSLLAITTLGFPSAMAVRALIQDELKKATR